jgi:VIT1/CCC1 family predicted Fe2+/Mn2+ transporter
MKISIRPRRPGSDPDPTELAATHTPAAIQARLASPPSASYLRDFIYGAIDGTVTTFAIVAGVEGAALSAAIVIILGLANLCGDGFSMAASNFLASRAQVEERRRAWDRERRQIGRYPEGEREEIRQIFAAKGFSGPELDRAVEVITADEDLWIETMMTEELGYAREETDPLRAAAATFIAFVLVGFIPIAAFVWDAVTPFELDEAFLWSALMTAIAFLAVGIAKSRIVGQSSWRGGIETLAVGGVAATLAYIVGNLLSSLAS